MMSMFHLKTSNFFFLLFFPLLIISCKNDNQNNRINKTLDEAGLNKVVIYQDKFNDKILDGSRYSFMNGQEILKRMDENFFLLTDKKIGEKKYRVSIYSFKSGESTSCIFENDKFLSKEVVDIKPMESKPYYIYYEILKRKYPQLMDWSKFPIPKDSLK